ncbi:hypothetical protein CCU22_00165 [Candidatus Legionella polyplacis]|nr:hypothetical protein CCU22_00165 [Candidatus Legionella polyplacis]
MIIFFYDLNQSLKKFFLTSLLLCKVHNIIYLFISNIIVIIILLYCYTIIIVFIGFLINLQM